MVRASNRSLTSAAQVPAIKLASVQHAPATYIRTTHHIILSQLHLICKRYCLEARLTIWIRNPSSPALYPSHGSSMVRTSNRHYLKGCRFYSCVYFKNIFWVFRLDERLRLSHFSNSLPILKMKKKQIKIIEAYNCVCGFNLHRVRTK